MNKFEFEQINNLNGNNVILVSGEGCANCVSMYNLLINIEDNYPNINFYYLEVEEKYLDFLDNLEVRSIPSVLIIKDNKLIDKCHGYQPEEILEIWLDYKLNN